MEIWKPIEMFNGVIEVSNMGRVRSKLRDGRILKASPDPKGYLKIKITVNRVAKSIKVHREVAKAFIDNPNNYPQVNHIDGDKTNNTVENLEWCTNKQNVIQAYERQMFGRPISVNDINYQLHRSERKTRTKLMNTPKNLRSCPYKKSIFAYKNGEIRQYESIMEAEIDLGTRHITDVLKGKRSHTKGWTFAYAEGGDA